MNMDPITAGFSKAGLSHAQRHLFLCLGPDCCAPSVGEATWDYLKSAVKKMDLPVLRTKAACFRICSGGPWLIIYPDGIWYGNVTPERCARILHEHIVGGQPIREWITQEHPFPNPSFSA
jgi:(2Fe-2S) ferredoxin